MDLHVDTKYKIDDANYKIDDVKLQTNRILGVMTKRLEEMQKA